MPRFSCTEPPDLMQSMHWLHGVECMCEKFRFFHPGYSGRPIRARRTHTGRPALMKKQIWLPNNQANRLWYSDR